jgi:DNA replicative helicase MCM subunit Mcm2 (Cdc46/Mcm family)
MQALGTLRANDIDNKNAQSKNNIPPELERQFSVIITHGENAKPMISKMREIRANSIGALVTIKGIVTRASNVMPCM